MNKEKAMRNRHIGISPGVGSMVLKVVEAVFFLASLTPSLLPFQRKMVARAVLSLSVIYECFTIIKAFKNTE